MRVAFAVLLGLASGCASVLGLDDYRAGDAGVDAAIPDGGADANTDARTCTVEVCTPTDAIVRAVDEDCDGRVDESSCIWSLGDPQFITTTQLETQLQAPVPTRDGLRLYYVSEPSGTIRMATRPSLGEPFGSPVDVALTGMPSGWRVVGIALDESEREMFVEANDGTDQDFFRSTRSTLDMPFAASGVPLSVTAPRAIDGSISLSHDGLELFFTSNRSGTYVIHRSRRTDGAAEFLVAQAVTLTGTESSNLDSPRLSLDGRTLFFRGIDAAGVDQTYFAVRESTDSLSFGRVTMLEGLDTGFAEYNFSPSEWTGEAFFISGRPWAPGIAAIWRVRLCRDGPCPVDEIECAPPAVRSAGGNHCYERLKADASFEEARIACEATGAHLATAHSNSELEAIVAGATGPTWLGASEGSDDVFEWLTGEPAPVTGFPAGAPSVPECLTLETSGTVLTPVACDGRHETVCERETWPAW